MSPTTIPDYVQTLRDRSAADQAADAADRAAIAAMNAAYEQYGDTPTRRRRYQQARDEFRTALRRVTSSTFDYDQELLERLGIALVEFEARRDEAGPFILTGYDSPQPSYRHSYAGEDPDGTDLTLGKDALGEAPTTEEQAAFTALLAAAREAVA